MHTTTAHSCPTQVCARARFVAVEDPLHDIGGPFMEVVSFVKPRCLAESRHTVRLLFTALPEIAAADHMGLDVCSVVLTPYSAFRHTSRCAMRAVFSMRATFTRECMDVGLMLFDEEGVRRSLEEQHRSCAVSANRMAELCTPTDHAEACVAKYLRRGFAIAVVLAKIVVL